MNAKEWLASLPPLPPKYKEFKKARDKLHKILCGYQEHSWKCVYNMTTTNWRVTHYKCSHCKVVRSLY